MLHVSLNEFEGGIPSSAKKDGPRVSEEEGNENEARKETLTS